MYQRTARRLGTVHVFTLSGTSQASAAFGSQTRAIRLATSTQPAHFVINSDPTAAATDNLMPAGWVEDVVVNPGEKIAVLQAGTAGSISVTELT